MKQTLDTDDHSVSSNSIRSPRSLIRFGTWTGIPAAIIATVASACSEIPTQSESVSTAESEIRYGYFATPFVPGTNPVESKAVIGLPGCTGTLVDPEWVLTAKHCVCGNGVCNVGGAAFSRRPQGDVIRFVDVARPIPGPTDGVLLHLSQPFNDLPIALLNSEDDSTFVNQAVSAYGYGAIGNGGACTQQSDCATGSFCQDGQCFVSSDGRLRYGDNMVVKNVYAGYFTFAGNSLGQMTLPGDSGGPVFRNGTIAGVNITWNDLGNPGLNSAVSVPQFRSWLLETIASIPSTMDKTITLATDQGLPPADAGWRVYGVGDFDGDGNSDLVWRRINDTLEARLWLRNADGTVKSDLGLPAADAGWRIYGVGDFNGDGKSDLVWRRANDTSEARIWLLDGSPNVVDQPLPSASAGLRIQGVGDFNGDGLADLLWRNADDSGAPQIWLLKNGTVTSRQTLPAGSPGWRVNGIGDFNGDGRSDLVLRLASDTGEPRIWMQKDGAVVADVALPSAGAGWRINGIGDFNGDGRSDLVWRLANDTGEPVIWLLKNGVHIASQVLPSAGADWKIYAAGDCNGNGRSDLILRRTNDTGEARIWGVNSAP